MWFPIRLVISVVLFGSAVACDTVPASGPKHPTASGKGEEVEQKEKETEPFFQWGPASPASYPNHEEVYPLSWWNTLHMISGGVEFETGYETRRDKKTKRLYTMLFVPGIKAQWVKCIRSVTATGAQFMVCTPDRHYEKPYCATFAEEWKCNPGRRNFGQSEYWHNCHIHHSGSVSLEHCHEVPVLKRPRGGWGNHKPDHHH